MAMNERNNASVATIEMPEALVTQMFFDVHRLAEMHQDLIHMYEKESALKKHHKAYLHVRDRADEMCRQDKNHVAEILDHYKNPGRHIQEAIDFHESIFGASKAAHVPMKVVQDVCKDDDQGMIGVMLMGIPVNEELCRKCPYKDECEDEQEEDSEKEISDSNLVEEKSLDAFALPEGMVMMSTGTLGVMQDDMLALTATVDRLVQAFRSIEEGGGYDCNLVNKITGEATSLSEDVFHRWDDAELAELS